MLYFFLIKKKFCIALGRLSCSQSPNFVEYISNLDTHSYSINNSVFSKLVSLDIP